MTIGRTQLGPQCQGHKQTTDATADQLLLTCPIPFKHSATVDLWIIGIATSGDKLVEHSVHSVTRDGATATYVGEVSNGSYSSGAGAWVTTVDCTGTGLRVRITGEAGHTIEWHAVASFAPSAVNVPIVWECSATPLDSTMSFTLRVTNLVNYWIDWGDGNFDAKTGNGADQATTHNYASAGHYAIRIMIADRANLLRLQLENNSLRGQFPDLSGSPSLFVLYFHGNTMSGPMMPLPAGLGYFDARTGAVSGSIPSLTALTGLTNFVMFGNALTGYTASTIAATCTGFYVHSNLLPQSAIDQILADFATGVAGRPAAGTISLGGTGNAAPSAAGLASKAAILAAKPGWTITHN